MKPYYELLREVRDSLTKENWVKGYYFDIKNNIVYMSIHGAAQRLVNPQVRKALEDNNIFAARRCAIDASPAAAVNAAVAILNNNHILSIWKNRPNWVKEDYIYDNKNYGNLNLHYLVGMFGLTKEFESKESTTLDMIQERLSETAIWAEENEEFLMSN
jgi:hypothetical protein